MGLDMYAYTVNKDVADKAVDFVVHEHEYHELMYWRKFNALHGWMERLYRKKGGSKESFNCTTVQLTSQDLDDLERDKSNLKPVEGFFFGAQEIDEWQLQSVDTFIAKARDAIQNDNAVFYYSWW